MKKNILFIFSLSAFFFITPMVYAQYTLTIEISELKSNNGQVIMQFCNAKGERISRIIQPIKDKKSTITIKDLKPGTYSFKYFHDENKNDKLDFNLIKMPKEGCGTSNNAKGTFGPPPLNKTIFKIDGNKIIYCKPTYI